MTSRAMISIGVIRSTSTIIPYTVSTPMLANLRSTRANIEAEWSRLFDRFVVTPNLIAQAPENLELGR